jgi:hypothetical protein
LVYFVQYRDKVVGVFVRFRAPLHSINLYPRREVVLYGYIRSSISLGLRWHRADCFGYIERGDCVQIPHFVVENSTL